MNVDVIIPIYKPNKWLFEAIDSVYNQTYSDWHITVVDDCTPLPNAIIDQIQKNSNENTKVTYIRLPSNCRAAEARNIGIKRSKEDLIAFLDQDDKWFPEKIEKYIRFFESKPDIKLIHSDIEGIDSNGQVVANIFERENEYRRNLEYESMTIIDIVKELFNRYSIRLGTIVVNKKAFEKVGGFNGNLFGGEDEEFVVRFASKYSISHLPHRLTYRRIHSRNVSRIYNEERVFGKLKSIEVMGNDYPYLDILFKKKYTSIIKDTIRIYLKNKNWSMAKENSLKYFKMKPIDIKAIVFLISSFLEIDIISIKNEYWNKIFLPKQFWE